MVNLLPIILLWFISFDLSTQTKIEVEYDNYLDVITLNGKLYIPTDSRIQIKSFAEETPLPQEEEKEECGETLITGPAVWFFVFIVGCKFLLLIFHYSPYDICWSYVWTNCGIPLCG